MIRPSPDAAPPPDASYTKAADHTTAAAIGKRYEHDFPSSPNPRKTPGRTDDGHVSSAAYVRGAEPLADQVTPDAFQIDFHHPLEDWLARRPIQWLLKRLSVDGPDGTTALERIFLSYRNGAAPLWQRIKYWPIHLLIDRLRGTADVTALRRPAIQQMATLRGLVIVARSLGEFGLTAPQRFTAPLFTVWNLTNRCNLSCRHCYQDSRRTALGDELGLAEKLDLVDQMGRAHIPMLAVSGGEPTLSKDLLPVLRRARQYHLHTSLATNGTTLTRTLAAQLAEAGLRYVEISLDSVDPRRHDAFRGVEGMWARAVEGARNVVATGPLRLGIAMCVHQGNFHEVRDMIRFAEDIGAGCFAHFNFIPVGRGLKMVSGDITPQQREELLAILNEKMQEGRIGVLSTAPQLGRVCLAGAAVESGRATCSHCGSGSGVKARAVAKYLGGCGAGRTYICIEPNGDVTPCVYLPHRVMGNVRRSGLIEIFRNSVFWRILNDRDHRLHHCEVCAFKTYCGGCRARADAYYGHLHAGDPGCIFNARHWDRLVETGVVAPQDPHTPAAQMDLGPRRHGMA